MVNLRIPAKQTHAPFLQRQRQAEIAAIREFGGWHRDDSVERVGGTGKVIRWVAPGRHVVACGWHRKTVISRNPLGGNEIDPVGGTGKVPGR